MRRHREVGTYLCQFRGARKLEKPDLELSRVKRQLKRAKNIGMESYDTPRKNSISRALWLPPRISDEVLVVLIVHSVKEAYRYIQL